ncbi:heavy metal-associated isoprenylated plant protein 39 isoform X2 [Cryptomeria japonica]|uniref:heavy metal-associated isoprenylated plant protein 39 isoform X2 n=1 Tax=Cryptomeria japonica TaxID=3369 RepID=UPI0025ACCA09|nr:heavy metal-associated isoprenylated plant protein 39 isoform X2 [Cryptomeria japonica]
MLQNVAVSAGTCGEGVDSVQVDMKEQKITVIGDADPVSITKKLRKLGRSEILSFGPSKEPEKKPAEKKAEEKKEPAKKEDSSKPNPGPNITYVYLPSYWDSWHGGYYYY